MTMVDRTLTLSGMLVFMQGSRFIAQGILLFTAQRLLLVTLPFILGIVYVIQKFYLQTSRQLRFMDLEAKAPVYSQFLETLEGLATIRAFNWEKQSSADNIAKLDKALVPYYLLFCIQRWLNLVLDLLVAVLAIAVIVLVVYLRDSISGGQVGIALNVILGFNFTLLRLAECYTSMETALGAISRLKSFDEQTECEDKPEENHDPGEEWPEKGEVEFRNVNASYG